MNPKLLTFILLCFNVAHSSQPEQTLSTQYFLDQFNTHFTKMEQAQALFVENPTDRRFIELASNNIAKLSELLKTTARLCTKESETAALSDHADRLQSIITVHMRLTQIYQEPKSLCRAHSAIILPTQERPLTDQKQHMSFRQPKSDQQ